MKKPRVVRIGDATLYLGDCRDVVPGLAGEHVVVTDPPYGVKKDYGPLVRDDLTTFRAAVSMVHDTGCRAAVHVPASRIYDLPARPQWTAIWNKPYGASALIAYPIYPHWEAICFYNIKGDFKGNRGHRSDVYTFKPVRPSPGGHPTPKPIDLIESVVSFMAGGAVLDPFMGGGTTGVACVNLGRAFTGIEIEPRFFDMAVRAIEAAHRARDLKAAA